MLMRTRGPLRDLRLPPASLHVIGIFHGQFVAECRLLVLGVGGCTRSQEAKFQAPKQCSSSLFLSTVTTLLPS